MIFQLFSMLKQLVDLLEIEGIFNSYELRSKNFSNQIRPRMECDCLGIQHRASAGREMKELMTLKSFKR